MTSTPTKTRSSHLPTLDRRLLAYAFAGGAAAASAPTAVAAIVYSGPLSTQLTVGGAAVGINVDGVPGDDLVFSYDNAGQYFSVTPGLGFTVEGGANIAALAPATLFPFGSAISYNLSTTQPRLLWDYDALSGQGNFSPGSTGYLGFKGIGYPMNWGWVSVTLPGTNTPGAALIINGWGYETTPGTQLTAGQVPSSVPDAPSAAVTGLAALSLGAAGLARRRAQRQAA